LLPENILEATNYFSSIINQNTLEIILALNNGTIMFKQEKDTREKFCT